MRILLLLIVLWAPVGVLAKDTSDTGGLDWEAALFSSDYTALPDPSPWYGSLAFDNFFALRKQPGSRMRRQELSLIGGWQSKISEELKGRFSVWVRHDNLALYEDQDIDYGAREARVEAHENYIEWNFAPSAMLRAGRQKIGLGYSQGFRVLDTLSPIDNRIPGYGELSQLKLPQGALNLNLQQGNLSHRAFYLAEQRPDLVDKDGEFGMGEAELNQTLADKPAWAYSLEQQQSGWDWQVALGQSMSPQLHHSNEGAYYQSESWAGFTLGAVRGSWRGFTEQRWARGRDVLTPGLSAEAQDSRQHLLGLIYTGISKLSLRGELIRQEREFQDDDGYFIGLNYRAWRDTLTFSWQHSGFMTVNADLNQVAVEYNWRDGWYIKIGALMYSAQVDSSFGSLVENDRVYIVLSGHF